MFTGIIQDIGVIHSIARQGSNISFTISGDKLVDQINIGDSVAISGVCLTVTRVDLSAGRFLVTAVTETIGKTKLASLRQGDRVNLELALQPTDRLGGHFVQGHIDAVGDCLEINQAEGSWIISFRYPSRFAALLIEKGSIAVDGVSLTAYDRTENHFKVSVIPHTWQQTTFCRLQPGDSVNLEFDMLGKYILNYNKTTGATGLTIEKMREHGF